MPICISLLLHALLFSAAIQIGNSLTVAEPKVIEVELGALPDIERQTDARPKAAPRVVKAPSSASPHEAESCESKQAVAAAQPVPPTPSAEKDETRAVVSAFATGAVAFSELTENSRSGGNSAVPASAAASGNAVQKVEDAKESTLPYVISGPPPTYPADARSQGWTGKVRVKVLISEQGTVKDVVIAKSSGHASLDTAALKGLRHWLFSPAYKDGRAITAWVVVPVLFRLD